MGQHQIHWPRLPAQPPRRKKRHLHRPLRDGAGKLISSSCGSRQLKVVTRNCGPKLGCVTYSPPRSTSSPSATPGISPTAVTSSPPASRSTTAKPVSLLANVICSTVPASCSVVFPSLFYLCAAQGASFAFCMLLYYYKAETLLCKCKATPHCEVPP